MTHDMLRDQRPMTWNLRYITYHDTCLLIWHVSWNVTWHVRLVKGHMLWNMIYYMTCDMTPGMCPMPWHMTDDLASLSYCCTAWPGLSGPGRRFFLNLLVYYQFANIYFLIKKKMVHLLMWIYFLEVAPFKWVVKLYLHSLWKINKYLTPFIIVYPES